jgi:large subunit ribosomal protein L21e
MCCCHYQLHVLLPAAPAPVTKRLAAQPRAGYMLTNVKPETITAIPYDIIKEGLQ